MTVGTRSVIYCCPNSAIISRHAFTIGFTLRGERSILYFFRSPSSWNKIFNLIARTFFTRKSMMCL